MLYNGLRSYADKSQRKYIHFVDGGITDNMGLRAAYDLISVAGGPRAFFRKVKAKAPPRLVVISVNRLFKDPTRGGFPPSTLNTKAPSAFLESAAGPCASRNIPCPSPSRRHRRPSPSQVRLPVQNRLSQPSSPSRMSAYNPGRNG